MTEDVPPQAGQVPPNYPPPPPPPPANYPPPPPQYGTPVGLSGPAPLNRPYYGCGPVEATKRFFQNYARFRGRASRSEFWWPFLALTVAAFGLVVVAIIALAIATGGFAEGSEPPAAFFVFIGLLVLLWLGTFVPSIAVAVRRLHDADLSGWFYLLTLIPYLGGVILIVFGCLNPKPEGARFDD